MYPHPRTMVPMDYLWFPQLCQHEPGKGWDEDKCYSSSLACIKPWVLYPCHTPPKASADLISHFTNKENGIQKWEVSCSKSGWDKQSGFRNIHYYVLASAANALLNFYFSWHTRSSQRLWSLSKVTLVKSGRTRWAWWYVPVIYTQEAEAGGFQESRLLLSLLFFFLMHYWFYLMCGCFV